MQTSITADSPWQEALRFRPLLAEKLGAHRSDFWERPQARLREFFPGDAGVLESLLHEAEHGPVPAPGSPWRELSAAHLLDLLTQNHRDFFNVTLADIDKLFAMQEREEPLDAEMKTLRGELAVFAGELRARADSDENDLFPRVLRYEACLRDPRVNPEFNEGSLRIAVAYRTSQSRKDAPKILAELIARLRKSAAAQKGNSWLSLLEKRLEDLRDHVAEHERLKAEVLYPMALEAEKTLYNRSIAGNAPHRLTAA